MDNAARRGLTITLHKAAQTALLTWVPISPRLANVVFKEATMNIAVVMVYALTFYVEDEAKYSFYTDLYEAIGHIPSRDLQIVTE